MAEISFRQKTALVIFGIVSCALIVESALRIAGSAYLFSQERHNKLSDNRFDPRQYRILCLGESTTACEGDTAYPRQLEGILNQRIPGMRFNVINKGAPGTDTSGILGELEENLNRYRPHMVIAMMGINDDSDLAGQISHKGVSYFVKKMIKGLRVYKLARLISLRLRERYFLGNLYLERGRDLQSQGRYPEAEELYKKSIALDINNPVPYVDLAWCYNEQGGIPKAEEAFKKAITIKPKDYSIYIELGQFYQEHKRYLAAEAALKKALETSPDNDTVYISLGWCYGEQGKHLQAEEAFAKAIELRPLAKIGYTELAQYYYTDKDFYPQTEEMRAKVQAYFDKVRHVTEDYNEGTRRNYNQLREVLSRKGIKLVCMQYAARGLKALKDMFDSPDGIIFVDNEAVFKEALKQGRYEDYFIDRFAGDFGHCTPLGNKIIADNVADVLWKEHFSKLINSYEGNKP